MNIAFLSTYPPRECGLATFTQDLVNNLDKLLTADKTSIIAVSNRDYQYENKVILELNQHDRKSYKETAHKINNLDIDLMVIEHEYGIFGGECGEYLLELLDNLNIPTITTLHTVLSDPSKKQKDILHLLGQKSQNIITMAKNTMPLLSKIYNIDPEKIVFIPHGVPFKKMIPREELKAQNGLLNRTVISTFGLLNPGKGLEYGIEAIAQVVKKHPEVIYLILGQTHPGIMKDSGESYRELLENLVEKHDLKENVRFINKYLSQDEIIHYLQLSDIYMTPYLNKEQAVSGTLAYAVGYGRVAVSTPYSYAKEMLANGRGLLAEFNDSRSLAKCINFLLDNPAIKTEMEKKVSLFGKNMMWEQVAARYSELFNQISNQFSKKEVKAG